MQELTKREQAILSEAGRIRQSMVKNHNGGRPRTSAKRCPCGVMTLKRAQSRGRGNEHAAGCTFAWEGE